MSTSPDVLVVIVTEATWGSALHALRSAKRTGASTLAAVIGVSDRVLSASRYCDLSVQLPDGTPDAVGEALAAVINRYASERAVVVVPLGDRLAGIVDSARHRFVGTVQLAVPEHDTLFRLLRKSTALEAAAECGLSVPEFVLVDDTASLDAALRLQLPVVVRPDGALDPSGGCGKAEVYSCQEALSERLSHLLDSEARVVVQTQVVAPERSVEFGMCWRSRDGSAVATCTGRKRRQSHRDGGVMVWGEAEALTDVDLLTRQFIEHVDFTGVGGAEFIRADGRLRFIEFNPRPESIHFLATAAGVDLLALEIEHLANGTIPEVPKQHPAAGWVGSAALTRARAEPSALPKLVVDRIKFGRARPHVRAILDMQDLAPSREVARLLLRRLSRFGRRK